MVVAKCLKLIWNHSGIISGTYFSPFQGFYYLYRGLRRAPKPYFGLILEFLIIFLIFLMNNFIEYSGLYWMNILDFVLNWIIFRPNSMKKWIFKTDRPGLGLRGPERLWLLTTRAPRVLKIHNAYIQEQPRPHQYVSLCNLQHLDTPQTQGLCMSVGWDQQQWQEYQRRPFSHCVAPSTVDVKPLDCRLCY